MLRLYRPVTLLLGLLFLSSCDDALAQRRSRDRSASRGSGLYGAPPSVGRFSSYSTHFDGLATAGGDYADCGDPATMDGATTASWSAWIRAEGSWSARYIWAKYAVTPSYMFAYQARATGSFRFEINSNAGGTGLAQITTPTGVFAADTWYHVVITYDGGLGVANDRVKIYVNTTLITGNTYTNSAPTALSTGTTSTIRFATAGSGPAGHTPWRGLIDEAAIWVGLTLSQTEITELYNAGQPSDLEALSFAAPTLWWRMGEGDTYPTILEVVSGAADCTMVNMAASDFVNAAP